MHPVSAFRSSLGYGFAALEPVLSRESVQYHFINTTAAVTSAPRRW